jgi:NAD(P)-dependent dehydrogenase (short-subunit alcohol dehydrogenase family)
MALLDGKVALVTGGGSGIGRAACVLYAREGAKVVVVDVVEPDAQETVRTITDTGGQAVFVRADVGRPQDCQAMVDSAVREFGQLDIAFNNAGIGGPAAPTGEYPIDGWQRVIEINLSGVFYCMRYEIPVMLKNGGAIVNMASILGTVAFAGAPAYVAAKHGVIGLTKTAALEYSAQGLRINAVGPAFINTPLVSKNMDEQARGMLASMHPIGRLGEPKEVAELVVWLSSDKASFITGVYYPIDGGYLAR